MSPRAFSEAERRHIRSSLLKVAGEHFARFGYRKTSVAEVARDAGIGKGSVYLFFDSKIEILLVVAREAESKARHRLLTEMQKEYTTPRERVRRFFELQFEALQENAVLRMMTTPEEAAAIMRDLPRGTLNELRASDEAFFAGIAEEWQRSGALAPVDPQILPALARAIFAMSLQRDLIGEDVFPAVVEVVIDGLSSQLTARRGSAI